MQIDVEIKGNQPLLLHKYTVATISEPKGRFAGRNVFADEWRKGTYVNDKEELILPSLNLMACIFDGAKGGKQGKTSYTRIVNTSLVISPIEPNISFENSTTISLEDIAKKNWLHTSGAVVTGRRVDRVRSMLPPGWKIVFQILTRDDRLSSEEIKDILVNAGKVAGLGDWRPSAPKKPGPYGTFDVVKFEVA